VLILHWIRTLDCTYGNTSAVQDIFAIGTNHFRHGAVCWNIAHEWLSFAVTRQLKICFVSHIILRDMLKQLRTYLRYATELIFTMKTRDLIVARHGQNVLAENERAKERVVIVVFATTLNLYYRLISILM
jgi:hypothetical protein